MKYPVPFILFPLCDLVRDPDASIWTRRSVEWAAVLGEREGSARNVLLVADPDSRDGDAAPFLVTQSGTSAQELVQQINERIASLNAWVERMLRSIVVRDDLETFLSICAEALDNPIACFDSENNPLAIAGKFEGPIEGTYWEEVVRGQPSIDFFSHAELRRFADEANRSSEPFFYRPAADPSHEYVNVRVPMQSGLDASIGSIDVNSPFDKAQCQALRIVADHLSLYLQNNDIGVQSAGAGMGLVSTLCAGGTVPASAVRYLLAKRGWRADTTFALVAVVGDYQQGSSGLFLPFVHQLRKAYPEAFVARLGDAAVLLFEVPEGDYDEFCASVERRLPAVGVGAGASALYANVFKTHEAYLQARAGADRAVAENVGQTGTRFVRFDSLAPILADEALSCLFDTTDAAFDQRIVALCADPQGRDLVCCLKAFLVWGANASRASRGLYLHRNTLMYRIGKIGDVLGVDFERLSEEQALYYELSCWHALRATEEHFTRYEPRE